MNPHVKVDISGMDAVKTVLEEMGKAITKRDALIENLQFRLEALEGIARGFRGTLTGFPGKWWESVQREGGHSTFVSHEVARCGCGYDPTINVLTYRDTTAAPTCPDCAVVVCGRGRD